MTAGHTRELSGPGILPALSTTGNRRACPAVDFLQKILPGAFPGTHSRLRAHLPTRHAHRCRGCQPCGPPWGDPSSAPSTASGGSARRTPPRCCPRSPARWRGRAGNSSSGLTRLRPPGRRQGLPRVEHLARIAPRASACEDADDARQEPARRRLRNDAAAREDWKAEARGFTGDADVHHQLHRQRRYRRRGHSPPRSPACEAFRRSRA